MSILRFAKTSGGSVSLITNDTATHDQIILPEGNKTLDYLERTGNELEKVYSTTSSDFITSSTSYVSTGKYVTITPSLVTSNIDISIYGGWFTGPSSDSFLKIVRTIASTSTDILSIASGNTLQGPLSSKKSDSPSTTSAVTYTLWAKVGSSGTIHTNNTASGTVDLTLVAIEIAG